MTAPASAGGPILALRHLNKTFLQGEAQIRVLQNLNLTLDQGQTLSIVGPSGSGKSTLLSLIAGLDKPDSGDVEVNGHQILKMTESELAKFRRENLGIVFQQFHLFSYLSALENVALPLDLVSDHEAQAKAKQALDQVGLTHRLTHYPHQLSGGEIQRVAIARAVVTRPPLLLADEPSGSLDQKNGDAVMDLIFKTVDDFKMSLILVTHNEALAKRCQIQFDFAGHSKR